MQFLDSIIMNFKMCENLGQKEKNVVVCQNIDIMMKREIVKTTKNLY